MAPNLHPDEPPKPRTCAVRAARFTGLVMLGQWFVVSPIVVWSNPNLPDLRSVVVAVGVTTILVAPTCFALAVGVFFTMPRIARLLCLK